MSTFDSVHWRDEAIHHLFDTIREMKRDVAHLEALVINAEMDRDAALEQRSEWGQLWGKATLGVLTLQDDLDAKQREVDAAFTRGHEKGWDDAKAEDRELLKAVAADIKSAMDELTPPERETDEDGLPTNYCPDCPGGGRFCNKCLPPGPGCPCGNCY